MTERGTDEAGAIVAYEFAGFRLEVSERRLWRAGQVLSLSGKAFDTLCLLVAGAGALQTQQRLMDALWPDVAVEPNSLQQNISIVRRLLDGAPGVRLETVRGRGYRLHAHVREVRDVHEAHAAHSTQPTASDSTPAANHKSQSLYFCSAHDGARLAYARLGSGPPLVKAANWLNHLEIDWQGPIWKHWLTQFSREHCLVRYDARGNGLSDWQPPSLRFSDFVADLGAVFDAAEVVRAPVLGISQGAAVAVQYAALHPERVSALILVGGCARGWRVKGNAKLIERFEALMVLMRQGWGGQSAAFRQIFTSSFFPDANQDEMHWFNELQRQTATPDNAAALLSALGDLDVRDALAAIRVPTLVVHSRTDSVVPFSDGIELASGIRGARFVALEHANHLLLAHEPGWQRFVQEVERFVREVDGARAVP